MERTFDSMQQAVIDIDGGHHLVLAPPGCGKTDILVERIAEARRKGVEYADMLCLTFTNRAAKGMRTRLERRTANPVPDHLFVGNLHRFCSQMLFSSGVLAANAAIADEYDVDDIVQNELCQQLEMTCSTTELLRLQHLIKQMQLGMTEDLWLHVDILQKAGIQRLCDVTGRRLDAEGVMGLYADMDQLCLCSTVAAQLQGARMLRLVRAYENYKNENSLIDFDDLLLLAYDYLDTPEGGKLRYSWIEVDEVQDLNPLQLAIVEKLVKPNATVVYLGDEQQAIFSFIGAKLETLDMLKRRCGVNVHRLCRNYRSPSYLLQLFNDYANRCLNIKGAIVAPNESDAMPADEDLCVVDVDDGEMESLYAAKLAKRYSELDEEGRVAILVSTNREAEEVSTMLTAYGMPHFKISGADLFSTNEVRLIMAHLSVVADEMVFIAWARLLWAVQAADTYAQARNMMRQMRSVGLLPTDFLLRTGNSYLQQAVAGCSGQTVVVFDTETTGLDPTTDDIIQIAAIKVRDGHLVGQPFCVVLHTDKPLPAEVGGHVNPMLEVYAMAKKERRADGLRKFIDYCAGLTLVGHNVEYDYEILRYNMMRYLPEVDVACVWPQRFDTLKMIRLVRPRLKHYKLGALLETLHLEGSNTHRADDDIVATWHLLDFCIAAAKPLIARQEAFAAQYHRQIERLCSIYRPLYLHAMGEQVLSGNDETSALVREMQYAYQYLLQHDVIQPIDKWEHLLHYVDTDLVRTDLYSTLKSQLERYVVDLATCKEADLCGESLRERHIISTVHKAKGLEFDTVIVYRAIDGCYPRQQSWTEPQMQEDARRLFVAMSRTKRRLCITTDTHYRSSPHHPSLFLQKVGNHFCVYRRMDDGKIRKVSHRQIK